MNPSETLNHVASPENIDAIPVGSEISTPREEIDLLAGYTEEQKANIRKWVFEEFRD